MPRRYVMTTHVEVILPDVKGETIEDRVGAEEERKELYQNFCHSAVGVMEQEARRDGGELGRVEVKLKDEDELHDG